MAQRPDGKSAKPERVSFTRPAAERIAKVVRTVEAGDRDAGPLSFGYRDSAAIGKAFRICTFTGSWAIGSSKTVTFKHVSATPNTAAATNLFFPVPDGATRDCAIAKDGTAWFLVDVPLRTASASFVTDISLSASLNTSNCTITVSKTLTTSSATYLQVST